MTRNDPEAVAHGAHGVHEQARATEDAARWHQEYVAGTRRAQRQPMTWPLAAFGLGVLLFLGFMAWLVAGLIRDLAG